MTDKSPKIFAYDDLHPEDAAMLQALYSRSPDSVVNHLDKVKKAGSGKFMASYYVGYGHASIGDCGVTTIFIENYSMLAAKAVQDNPLYSGQEASTRYLNFAEQPLINPFENQGDMADKASAIQSGWLDIYNTYLPKAKEALMAEYPFNDVDYKSERIWHNALEARAFDTLRGFLPVGSSTLFSWTTNLRQARDKLMKMRNHPLPEMQQLSQDLFAVLKEKYPNSFNGSELNDDNHYGPRHAYEQQFNQEDFAQTFQDVTTRYQLTDAEVSDIKADKVIARTNLIDIDAINSLEADTLRVRPKGSLIPSRLKAYGSYTFVCQLDFGSYRDLQRHRGGHCPLPVIDNSLGFNSWYLEELQRLLSAEDYSQLSQQMNQLLADITALETQGTDKNLLQYLYPMGMNVPVTLTYTLPQAVYVAELRAAKTVHASLRPIAQQMADIIRSDYPNIALYVDYAADNWDAKRGEQTIAEKKSA